MAKRRKKEIEVPESENLFTAKQIDYIARAAKMIPWEVDIQHAQINVPQAQFELAEEHLTVRHLVNEFGFAVQATIGAMEVRTVFDPELKAKRAVEAPEVQSFIKVGDKFKVMTYVGECILHNECIEVKDDTAYMKAVGQMASATPTPIKTIEDMVRRKAWVRIYE